MNEVEAVARAIEDQLTVEDGWEVGTTALRNMCIDFAHAAIAALDAARGDAEPVAWMPIETAPKDGTFIQLFEPLAQPPVSVGCYDDEAGWLIAEADFMPSKCQPRCWAPLLPRPDIAPDAKSKSMVVSDKDYADRIAELEAEVERLRTPQWYYHPDYTETCQVCPWEVIEYYDLEPGKHIVEIQTARPLPSIWSVVHVLTDDEKDAMGTDDEWLTQDFTTEDEARAALALARGGA